MSILSGQGNKEPGGIMVVGRAPTGTDISEGRLFSGTTGQILKQTLTTAGVDLERVYFTTAVDSYTPGEKPSKKLILENQHRLLAEIMEVQPSKILALGATAYSALREGKSYPITKIRGMGSMLQIADRQIYTVPTYDPGYILQNENTYRDFAFDVEKLTTNIAPYARPKIDVMVAAEIEQVFDFMLCYGASTAACDIETSGLNEQTNTIYSIGFAPLEYEDKYPPVLIIPHELLSSEELKDFLRQRLTWESAPGVVFHNAKFDIKFLCKYLGISHTIPHLWDTMLMHYLLDERSSRESDLASTVKRPIGKIHSLKTLARTYFDIDYAFDFKRFMSLPFEERPWQQLYEYQAVDCWSTAELYKLFLERMQEEPKLIDLHNNLLIPATQTLAESESYGVLVDKEYLKELEDTYANELMATAEQLKAYPQQLGCKDFVNLNSYQQLSHFLYQFLRVPGMAHIDTYGDTKKATLEKIADHLGNEEPTAQWIKMFLDWRAKSKLLNTYIRALIRETDDTGRIHPNFLLHGTSTGRLSSDSPNIQNQPRTAGGVIRKAFIVPEHYVWVKADMSQLELRVIAWTAQDREMIRIYKDDLDLHRETAASSFHKKPEDVTALERDLAKPINFGVVYLRGAYALAHGQEMDYLEKTYGIKRWTVAEAQNLINSFFRRFPAIKYWQKQIGKQVEKYQYVETVLGRKRRFPFLHDRNRFEAQREGVNFPIQSLASDIVLSALVRLSARFKEPQFINRARILVTVHDEIDFEIHEDVLAEALQVIREEMETPPIPMNIPLKVEIKTGKNWAALKEYKA